MLNYIESHDITLQTLIKILNTISVHSDDIYWIAAPDFKFGLYVSSAYEKIFGYPKETLLKDIRKFDTHLFPRDVKNYHPFLEIITKIKQEGPKARILEKYRIISQTQEVKLLEDRAQPLYDKHGKYIGIYGVASEVTCEKMIADVKEVMLKIFPKDIKSRYYLKGKYSKVFLTAREAECAYYLLKGKTSKETATLLGISYRTVEDFLQKIKHKLNVNYRSELFDVLIDNNFLQIK